MSVKSVIMTIIHEQVSKHNATSIIIYSDIVGPVAWLIAKEIGSLSHYLKDSRHELDIERMENKYLLELHTLPGVETKITKVNFNDYLDEKEEGEQKDE